MFAMYSIILCRRVWRVITRRQDEQDGTANSRNASCSILMAINKNWNVLLITEMALMNRRRTRKAYFRRLLLIARIKATVDGNRFLHISAKCSMRWTVNNDATIALQD